MPTSKKTPALAHYATKEITPLMQDYVAWLEAETGYKVDPLSVQLSGVLRSTFQKSAGNQRRIADAAARKQADAEARAARKAEREAAKAAQASADATPTRNASDPQAQAKSPTQPRSAATRGRSERGAQKPAKTPTKRAPKPTATKEAQA